MTAFLSSDAKMYEAYNEGKDLYAMIAQSAFDNEYEESFLKDNNKLLLNEPTKICSNKSDSCSIQEIEVYKVYYYDE